MKIAFVDFWPEWNVENFILPILKNSIPDVTIDNRNPDVVFHSIFNRMSETPKYKCKKVLVLAENWRPSQFGSNYSISFDPHSKTNFRLPLWQMYGLLNPEILERLITYRERRISEKRQPESFDRFCAFTVSNPSNSLRNNHFDILSSYKRVHAYGKVRMNTYELKRKTEGRYWRDAKDEFFLQNSHKFMMTYENSSYPYYCTEKLMDGFLAGSIPIYWGDPRVEEDWNGKAFINVNNNNGWLDVVKLADQNQTFFEEMYFQPVFTDEQKERHLNNLNAFEEWLLNII